MRPIPYYVLALAMAVPAVLLGVEIPRWLLLGSRTAALQSDLRVFYTPGYMLRTGGAKDIYDFSAIRRNQDAQVAPDGGAVPFLHPAYEVIFFVPLSIVGYRLAYLVWAGVNFAILGFVYFLLRPCLPNLSDVGPSWIIPGLIVGFMPVAFTILAGQDSLFLLLILVLAYRRIGSNEFQAGILLGLGMFRFQLLLPVVALFLLWRGLMFVTGWAVGSAAVLGMSFAVTGIRAQIEYAALLRQMSSVSLWLLLRRMPNLRGLFAACNFGMVPLALVSVSIFLAAVVMGARQRPQQRLLLAISASILVTYYLFLHDLSVLLLPALLATDEAIGMRDWMRAGQASVVLSGFAVLWFTHDQFYLGALLTLFFFVTQGAGLWRQGKGSPTMTPLYGDQRSSP